MRQWERAAAGLAAAGALAWLVSRLLGGSPGLGQAPGVVTNVAVPAVATWWAARRPAPHAPMGLAAVAAWGAAFHLPTVLAAIVLPGLAGAEPAVASTLGHLVPSGLAVAALVVALLALRARGDRRPLGAPGARKAAAGAVVLWGIAKAAASVVASRGAAMSPAASPAGPLLALLVIVVIAAVMWRHDGITVKAAVVVVTIGAVMRVVGALSTAAALGGATGLAVAVSAVGAAVLVVAAFRLVRATQVLS
jgi:hypothetical protein